MSVFGNILEIAAGVKLGHAFDPPPPDATLHGRVERLEACMDDLNNRLQKITEVMSKGLTAVGEALETGTKANNKAISEAVQKYVEKYVAQALADNNKERSIAKVQENVAQDLETWEQDHKEELK